MVFTAFCGRALWRALSRALCVHCTCTVQNAMFVLPSIIISRTLQCCFWRRGGTFYISAPCKTHSVGSPIFAHMRSKCCNVASSFVGSSCEDESMFGLGFWQMQKGICSSLCLHIHKPKNYVPSSFWGSSFEDESVFGLRFCQMQKGICSSLCLHIHKQKKLCSFFVLG